jgi:hypothetical protein
LIPFGHHVVYRPILINSIQRWWKSLPFLVRGESIRTFGRPKMVLLLVAEGPWDNE